MKQLQVGKHFFVESITLLLNAWGLPDFPLKAAALA